MPEKRRRAQIENNALEFALCVFNRVHSWLSCLFQQPARGLTLCFEFRCLELKAALYWWLFALGSGAGVGMRGSMSARVAAFQANHASIMELCITSAFWTRS